MKGIPSQGHTNVVIAGMSSTCLACGHVWDTNDADPPACERTEESTPIEREIPAAKPNSAGPKMEFDPYKVVAARIYGKSAVEGQARFVGMPKELGMGYGENRHDHGYPHAALNGKRKAAK